MNWYKKSKKFNLQDSNVDNVYDKFQKSYQEATQTSWDKNKFIGRASNWVFYGDEQGYVTVRIQRSGLYKLTGMAGNPKSVLKGVKELLAENKPTWGFVTSEIANMAERVGFKAHRGFGSYLLIKSLLTVIPKNVFGDFDYKLNMDGSVTFSAGDTGSTTKTLITNDAYISWLKNSLMNYTIPAPVKAVLDKYL